MNHYGTVCYIHGYGPGTLAEADYLGIKEYSEWPTIPQLYVNKEFVGGCDILMSMHQNGELAKLFEEKGVLVAAEEAPSEQETPAVEATAAPTTAGEETLAEKGTPGKS